MTAAGQRIRERSLTKIDAIIEEIEGLDTLVRTTVSATLTDTGRKHIDGKSIFSKTIVIANLPNTTTLNTAHSMSGWTDIWIVQPSFANNGTTWIPLPYVDVTAANSVEVRMSTTNIVIVTGADYSGYTGVVTLEATY